MKRILQLGCVILTIGMLSAEPILIIKNATVINLAEKEGGKNVSLLIEKAMFQLKVV